jgi:solute carrier family 25 carnitine/acylcarnitine transporter 20/29
VDHRYLEGPVIEKLAVFSQEFNRHLPDLPAAHFLYFTSTGVCNVVVGHPIDLVKVRMQTAPSTVSQITVTAASETTFGQLRTIFVKEGLRGLYRGVSAPLLAATPAFAISFYSYDIGKTIIANNSSATTSKDDLTVKQICMAGAFSGIPLAAVVGPSERIKCLMQMDEASNGKKRYRDFTDCLRQVYKEGGLRSGVCRGLGATCMRDVPGNAAYFGTYEFLRRELCRMENNTTSSSSSVPSLPATLFAGGMAGVANWMVAIPFDVLKSRLQTAPHGTYRNLFDVFQQLLQKEGVSALFRGLSPALIRAFPANAACLAGVEMARTVFFSGTVQ